MDISEPKRSVRPSAELITQEDLEDVFRNCDLPHRCRLRRVSRYWKHVISQPENNKVVLVNRRCLLLTKTRTGRYNEKSGRKRFRRGGLMGPHVRTLIYDGKYDLTAYHTMGWQTVQGIQAIGYYCSGVEHIVLWRVGGQVAFDRFRKKDFRVIYPSRLPQPLTLTLVASYPLVAFIRLPEFEMTDVDQEYCSIKLNVAFWQDFDQPHEEFVQQYLPVHTVAQREWLARHAPRLPELYRNWAAGGIAVTWYNHQYSHDRRVVAIDLRREKFDKSDWLSTCVQRCLAGLILSLNLPDTEPPPTAFDLAL